MKDPRKRINEEFPKMVYNPEVVRSKMAHIEENYHGLHPKAGEPDHRGAFVDIEQELERDGTINHFGLEDEVGKGAVFQILDQYKVSEPGSTTHPAEGYYKAPEPGKPVIMAFHGNAGLSSLEFLILLPEAIENGYGIYCPEYNSYAAEPDVSGLSKNDRKTLEKSHEASAQNLEKDAERAAKFLEDQGISHSDTIIYGQCLGSCPAIHLASKNSKDHAKKGTEEYRGLVVDSPMASSKQLVEENITQMVAEKNLTLPPLIKPKTVAGMLSDKHRIKNAEKMQDVTIPATVIYSPNDDVVPSHHHEAVFNALPESNKSTKLYKTPFEGHIAATMAETMDEINDLVYDRDKTKYREKSWSIRELTDENAQEYIKNAFQEYLPYVEDFNEQQQGEFVDFAVEFVKANMEDLQDARNANGVPTWRNEFYKALDAKRVDIRVGKTMEHLHDLPPTSITMDEFCDKHFSDKPGIATNIKYSAEDEIEKRFEGASPELQEYIMNRVAEELDKKPGDISMMKMFGAMAGMQAKQMVGQVIENIELEIIELQEQKAKAPEPEKPLYNDADIVLPETNMTMETLLAEYEEDYPKATMLVDGYTNHAINENFGDLGPRMQEHAGNRIAEIFEKEGSEFKFMLYSLENTPGMGMIEFESKLEAAVEQTKEEVATLIEKQQEKSEPEISEVAEPKLQYNDDEIVLPETSATMEKVFAEYGEKYPKAVEKIQDAIEQTIQEKFDDMGPRAAEHVENRFAEVFAKEGADLETLLYQIQEYPSMGNVVLNQKLESTAPDIKEEISTLIEEQQAKEGLAVDKKEEKNAEPEISNAEKESKAEEKEREKQAKEKAKSKDIGRQIEKAAGEALKNEDIKLVFDSPEKQEKLEEALFNNVASELKAQMAGEGTSEHQFCDEKGHRVKGWKNQVDAIVKEELNELVPPEQLVQKVLETTINQVADRVVDQVGIDINSKEGQALADQVYENLLNEIEAQSKGEGKSDIAIINDKGERDPDWRENIQNLAGQELVAIQERQLQESLKLDLTALKDAPSEKDPELKAAEKERAINDQIAKSVETALDNGPLNLNEEQRQEFGKQLTSQLIQEMNDQRMGKEADSPDTQIFKDNEHRVRDWRDNLDTLAQQQLHALEIKPLDLSAVKSAQEQEPVAVDKQSDIPAPAVEVKRDIETPPDHKKEAVAVSGKDEALQEEHKKEEIAAVADPEPSQPKEEKPKTRIDQIKEQLAQAGLEDGGVSSQNQDELANAISALKMAATMEGVAIPKGEAKDAVSKEAQPDLGEMAGQKIHHGEFVKKVAPEKYKGPDEVHTKPNESSTQIGKG